MRVRPPAFSARHADGRVKGDRPVQRRFHRDRDGPLVQRASVPCSPRCAAAQVAQNGDPHDPIVAIELDVHVGLFDAK